MRRLLLLHILRNDSFSQIIHIQRGDVALLRLLF
jgi:hypothetical protein